jgi:hypothetical protein
LNFVAQRAVARKFNQAETGIVKEDYDAFFDFYREHTDDAKKLLTVGQAEADKSLDVAQLAAWTMVCNELLNLDEVLNK